MVTANDNAGTAPPPLPPDTGAPITQSPVKKAKPGQGAGRQLFSCAECRRLKLKCSRTWPCASCEKRGCAQICPVGQMKTGKGKRLILADTEELHQRISLLEVALAEAHAKTSPEPHPLLGSPYLFTPQDRAQTGKTTNSSLMVVDGDDNVLENGLGVLTISAEGEARFVGSFAGSEYLRDDENKETGVNATGLATPPSSATAPVFEDTDGTALEILGFEQNEMTIEQFWQQLPDWETEGRFLVEMFWENVNWMYQVLPRPMFDRDHLPNAYGSESTPNAHKIACVFLVMAVGVLFDLNRRPYDPRAAELFKLGRACLNSVGLEHANPATVQALHLCGTYVLNHKGGNGAEKFWPILGTAIKVAQRLGLHRDGQAFGLSPYEVAERRQVWWEIITYDRLQALCFARPCATTNKASDTQFPEADPSYSTDTDGYHRAKYRLVAMMEKIIDVQTQTTAVSIQQVTQIDQEFRDFKETVPEILLPLVPIQDLPLDHKVHPHLIIHRLGLRLLIAQCRLLLNRPFFARALGEHPDDPSVGKFAGSFLAAYESALDIVHLVKQLVIYHPSLVSRFWFFWFHAFTASVCLGAIAIRAPSCAFTSSAFRGMTTVCEIARAVGPDCRAKRGLPSLLRLQRRAKEAAASVRKPQQASSTDDDDLSHLDIPVKLCRKASPPSKRNSPVDCSPLSASPHSPRSEATSATLIEPLHYDPVMGTLLPMSHSPNVANGGAVNPPPPAAETPLTSPWNTLGQMDLSPDSGDDSYAISDGLPFPWPDVTTFDFSQRPQDAARRDGVEYLTRVNGIESNTEGSYAGDSNPRPSVPLPSSGLSQAGLVWEDSTSGDEDVSFDFSLFVQQMGGNELGLGGTWQ